MLNISTIRFPSIIAILLLAVLAAGIGFLVGVADYNWQGLLLVPLAIIIAAYFLLPRMSRLDAWSPLLIILIAGLICRLGFSLLKVWIMSTEFAGGTDVTEYNMYGTIVAQYLWRLEFEQIVPFLQWGSRFISFFTGLIYSLIGPTLIGGFLVYAFLAFLGSYFFYRAFRVAFPQGDRRLYAILVFFFPSIPFWTSAISKDALIFLGIGLFAYGGAELIRNRLQGLVPLAIGLLCTLWIRPHIAAILAIALILALLVRGIGRGGARPVIFVIGLLLIGGFVWFLLPRLTDFLNLRQLSSEEIIGLLQQQQSLAYRGGSAFRPVDISNPLNFPMVIVTVLFRPFPWEAHNILALIQSLEGVIFIGLVLWRIKSIGKAVVSLISNPYVRFILLYVIAFIVVFSLVGNFGILARQRTMMLPFFLMLMAFAPSRASIEGKTQEVAI